MLPEEERLVGAIGTPPEAVPAQRPDRRPIGRDSASTDEFPASHLDHHDRRFGNLLRRAGEMRHLPERPSRTRKNPSLCTRLAAYGQLGRTASSQPGLTMAIWPGRDELSRRHPEGPPSRPSVSSYGATVG